MSSASDLGRERLRRLLDSTPDDVPRVAGPPVAVLPDQATPAVGAALAAETGTESQPSPQLVGIGQWWPPPAVRFRLGTHHLKALAVVLVVVVVAASSWATRARTTAVPLYPTPVGPLTPGSPASTAGTGPASAPSPSPGGGASSPSPAPAPIQVHVAGRVLRPGVVRLEPGARVHEAIAAAGGLAAGARLGTLNLAGVLSDGSQVIVAGPGEDGSVVTGSATRPALPAEGVAGGSGAGAPVNLNTATLADLETLPGVGPVTAGAIVAWREQHGRFTQVAELQEVEGIGPKTLERLAPHVTV